MAGPSLLMPSLVGAEAAAADDAAAAAAFNAFCSAAFCCCFTWRRSSREPKSMAGAAAGASGVGALAGAEAWALRDDGEGSEREGGG